MGSVVALVTGQVSVETKWRVYSQLCMCSLNVVEVCLAPECVDQEVQLNPLTWVSLRDGQLVAQGRDAGAAWTVVQGGVALGELDRFQIETVVPFKSKIGNSK